MTELKGNDAYFAMAMDRYWVWYRSVKLIPICVLAGMTLITSEIAHTPVYIWVFLGVGFLVDVYRCYKGEKYSKIAIGHDGLALEILASKETVLYQWSDIEIVKRKDKSVRIRTAGKERHITSIDYSRRDWQDFCIQMHQKFPKSFGLWKNDDVHA